MLYIYYVLGWLWGKIIIIFNFYLFISSFVPTDSVLQLEKKIINWYTKILFKASLFWSWNYHYLQGCRLIPGTGRGWWQTRSWTICWDIDPDWPSSCRPSSSQSWHFPVLQSTALPSPMVNVNKYYTSSPDILGAGTTPESTTILPRTPFCLVLAKFNHW